MVDRIAVRILGKACIAQLVVYRDTVTIVVEMIEEFLAAQIIGDDSEAILVFISTVISAQIAAGNANALYAVGLTNGIVFISYRTFLWKQDANV